MPAGNINTKDRFKRLKDIKDLMEDGLNDRQISEKTGMSVQTVKRNKKYLEELSLSDLTPEDIGKKRSEIYIELLDASEEARNMVDYYFREDKPAVARNWFLSYLNTVELRMKLYGLDNVKQDTYLTQINNYSGGQEMEKVSPEVAKSIRDSMIKKHEESLKNKEDGN